MAVIKIMAMPDPKKMLRIQLGSPQSEESGSGAPDKLTTKTIAKTMN